MARLYAREPAPGIKSSRVIGLADDIARSMSALSARVAVVSGRNVIGIELPNATREKVYLRELLAADEYGASGAKLPLCLGKTIGGEAVIVDLARMPHLLIAGTTGSGKSVAINTMILSLLYRLRPDQCRLIMVDPKMLELSVYDRIPHLLKPAASAWRKWRAPPACMWFSPRNVRRLTSSPAPLRQTSRPASRFRSLRKSTAVLFWAKWALSSCLDRATCCIWRAADASAACMAPSSRTKRSKR